LTENAISLENDTTPPPTVSRRRQPPLIKRLKPALVLENSGSVARDHLASERTFLAYVRTSLAVASAGVALVQLFTVASSSSKTVTAYSQAIGLGVARPLGAITVFFGLVVLVIGVTRYFTVQAALTRGNFPVARVTIAGVALFLCTLVAVVFGILVSGQR